MRYLFVNNFRGFYNTFIPILDINFFVGENSTGKTSILKLIKLLTLPQFWFNLEFSAQDVEFSHFGDMVSAFSDDKSHFDIGLIKTNKKNKNENNFTAFLMTFIEKNGMPFLSVFTYLKNNTINRIRFTKSLIKFKKINFNEEVNDNDIVNNIYPQWLSDHKNDTLGYSVLTTPEKLSIRDIPFIILINIMDAIDSKNKKRNKNLKGININSMENIFPLIFDEDIAWIAPIRTKPKHTYDMYKLEFSSEGDHTPYLIKKILDKDSESKNFKSYIKNIGLSSGLFDDIKIKKYGRSATAPFELDIILNKKLFSICSVGYGVSQSLPVIVELFTRKKNTWFAIQQPEVHLHPKAQAALGDLFYQLACNENKKFLIETHSDYTIDRFRINYRLNDSKKPDAQILYFERGNKGNKIYPIKIGENGELPKEQPKGYREFFIKEEMKILGLD